MTETETEIGSETVTDHYSRLTELYDELGEIDDELYAIGNQDFTGWYRTRSARGQWDGAGRPYALGKEHQAMYRGVERTAYATLNYVPARWFMDAWTRYKWDDDKEWDGDDRPTPKYADIRAYAPFADIDLADSVKHRRPDGEIPRRAIETALEEYIDAFAELAGGHDHVYALDSVGGAYVFVAPTATAPIARAFDARDRGRIYDELTDRLNAWLAETRDEINETVPEVVDVFDPDELNNKNRLYKAPLAIHTSLDGVVTPIDVENPRYEYTPIEDVTDALIDETTQWARSFTADHGDALDAIVARLWPEQYADADSAIDALRQRLEELDEREDELQRRRDDPTRDGRTVTPDLDPGEITDLDELDTTDELAVVNAAVEAIDVRDLARKLAAEWDTAPGRDPPRFAAAWHDSHNSGTSCYADRDKFVDLKEGKNGGGALKLIARHREIINHSRERVTGDDVWRAITELRKEGYYIPRFEGYNGRHKDVLGVFDDPDPDDPNADKRQFVRRLLSK